MLRHKKIHLYRLVLIFGLLVAMSAYILPAQAATLDNRSVRIADSKADAITSHLFLFDVPAGSLVGSIVLEYCANSPLNTVTCVTPDGLDLLEASLDSQSGEGGFSVHPASTANKIILSRPPVMTIGGPAQYDFSDVINPSSYGTYYVRISLHGSEDGSGSATDEGAVAFGIVRAVSTQAYVPPFLILCAGITVAPDCSSANGALIDLGELRSSGPSSGTSQYAGATNDVTGFSVSIHGNTLMSGNKIIPAKAVQGFSLPGFSQFGINLRDNFTPDVGQDPAGSGSSAAEPEYSLANNFKFVSGDRISNTSVPTEFNVFTVSYVVNVSQEQPPGIYNATFTYIAMAAF